MTFLNQVTLALFGLAIGGYLFAAMAQIAAMTNMTFTPQWCVAMLTTCFALSALFIYLL